MFLEPTSPNYPPTLAVGPIRIRTRVLVRKIQRDENTEGVGFCSIHRGRRFLVFWSRDDHIEASRLPPWIRSTSVPCFYFPAQAPYVAE